MRVFTNPTRAGAGGSSAVQRPLSRRRSAAPAAATAAGATSPSPAGARTPPATAGAPSSTCATWRRANSGPPRTSRRPAAVKRLRSHLHPGARRVPPAPCRASRRHTEISVSPEDDVELRRITITNRSSAPARRSNSPATRRWCWQPGGGRGPSGLQQSLRADGIRSHRPRPSFARGAPAPRTKSRRGCCISWWARAASRARSPARPTAPDSSGAAAASAAPAAMQDTARRCPTPSAPCSIRSSPCGARSRCRRMRPSSSTSSSGVAESREAALALVEKYQSPRMADRAFDLAWTHSQVTLRHLNATGGGGPALRPAGRRPDLRRPGPPRQPQRAAQQPARPKRALELRHFGRRADRPAAHQRPRRRSRSSGS